MYPWLINDDKKNCIDDFPKGWFHRFGDQLIEEINIEVVKNNLDYKVLSIGEQYGILKWEHNGSTEPINAIINKYKNLSKETCIFCGAPDALIYGAGWTHPACDKCKPSEKITKKIKIRQETELYEWDKEL